MTTPDILTPREQLVDDKGKITRAWWRALNNLFKNSGSLANPLTVVGSAILNPATVTSGGTISSPSVPAGTLIGNATTTAALPRTVTIGAGLVGNNDTLSVSTIPAITLMGNPTQDIAVPTSISLGANLFMQDDQLSVNLVFANETTLLYANNDPIGRLATLERTVGEAMKAALLRPNRGTVTEVGTGTGLTGGPITDRGTVSFAAIADADLLANTSGGSAAPIATTLTALIDYAIGNVQGDVLYRSASAWAVLAPGSAGNVLTTGGPAANPSWTAAATGTVTNVATGTGLTGGPITTTGTISLATIASHDILSNITGGVAAPVPNTVSDTLDAAIGSTQGDILYRGASAWSVLAPGTVGQFLQTGGASANPAWGTVADVGRNKLDNSMFNVAQRGPGPFTTNGAFTLDRWQIGFTTDTNSVTQATLNDTDRSQIGDEEAENGLQNVFTSAGAVGSNSILTQKIEDVYRLSNTTVQVSFWAKAAAGTPKLGVSIDQNFGSGGSSTVTGTGQSVTLSTTWARYSLSFAIASAATKTVGDGNYTVLNFWYSAGTTFNTRSGTVGTQSGTVILWGTQDEIGAVVTPLEKPTFRQQFMACQRFVFSTFGNGVTPAQSAGTDTGNLAYAAPLAGASSERSITFPFPVQMRTAPTITTYNVSAANAQVRDATAAVDCSAVTTVVTDHNMRIVATGNAATAVGNNLQVHVFATADL